MSHFQGKLQSLVTDQINAIQNSRINPEQIESFSQFLDPNFEYYFKTFFRREFHIFGFSQEQLHDYAQQHFNYAVEHIKHRYSVSQLATADVIRVDFSRIDFPTELSA